MKTVIYTMTHKKFDEPADPMYVPLQVGAAVHPSLGYLEDNTGDNISKQNCYYSELTGMYWVWKNVHDVDYVGICHYRRYLLNKNDVMFTASEIEELMQHYDIITTKKLELNFSYHYGFGENHNIEDLDETERVIHELYPAYSADFHRLVNQKHTYFGNICIMRKKDYDAYCKWLFHIFFELRPRLHLSGYDDYHKRVFGFISEFLLYVWVKHHKMKAYECKVGMTGEKVETKEVKEKLREYFFNKDIDGAKTYFRKCLDGRPDILMEASDVNGDLRVSMQMISTAEHELERYGHSYVDSNNDYRVLLRLFKLLNSIVVRYNNGTETAEDVELLKGIKPSSVVIEIAATIFCKDEEHYNHVVIGMSHDIARR
ncbi:MAG: DUF4422 domain-containing protein [Lachnospira sp.]|nr:DUF4422 domain-containing protein [Lachnospira sp.]